VLTRWSAKEATIKATTWRRLSFHDILVLRSRSHGGLVAVILDKVAGDSNGTLAAAMNDTDGLERPQDRSMSEVDERTDGRIHIRPDRLSDEEPRHAEKKQRLSNGDEADDSLPQHFAAASGDDSHFIEDQSDDLSGQVAKISISHDGEYATAVCLAAIEPMEGDVGGEAGARELF
jgi:phosphopantetheinyl transferase (holo-ACP synthase)